MIEDIRDYAKIKSESVKRKVKIKHRSKVLPRQFKESDLVMQRAQMNTINNKFAPKWSRPYQIKEIVGNGTYHWRHRMEEPSLEHGMRQA